MLILLPISTFLLMFLVILGRERATQTTFLSFGQAFLTSAVIWGTVVIVSTEILGLFELITREWISIVWFVALVFLIGWGVRSGALINARTHIRAIRLNLSRLEIIGWGSIGFIFILLLLVAWISPPNNVDSFLYHMSRVVHWAQHQSLRHYATTREHQLLKPIWAETAILHLRLLWGSDKPANLVQWFSMVGSVVGVTSIASLLGARRKGLLLTAAFASTIPMGILQASSTQNDYVTAFWAVCTAYYVVLSMVKALRRRELIALGLTLGLGFLTKGTFYVYAPPLMLWFFLSRLRPLMVRRFIGEAILLVVIAMTLNAPFWVRNVQTYGGPYGTSDWLRQNISLGKTSLSIDKATASNNSTSDGTVSLISANGAKVGVTSSQFVSTTGTTGRGQEREASFCRRMGDQSFQADSPNGGF